MGYDFDKAHRNADRQFNIIFGLAVAIIVATLAVYVGVAYVAAHFIAKIW